MRQRGVYDMLAEARIITDLLEDRRYLEYTDIKVA